MGAQRYAGHIVGEWGESRRLLVSRQRAPHEVILLLHAALQSPTSPVAQPSLRHLTQVPPAVTGRTGRGRSLGGGWSLDSHHHLDREGLARVVLIGVSRDKRTG
jgi:hypothetical protein